MSEAPALQRLSFSQTLRVTTIPFPSLEKVGVFSLKLPYTSLGFKVMVAVRDS